MEDEILRLKVQFWNLEQMLLQIMDYKAVQFRASAFEKARAGSGIRHILYVLLWKEAKHPLPWNLVTIIILEPL